MQSSCPPPSRHARNYLQKLGSYLLNSLISHPPHSCLVPCMGCLQYKMEIDAGHYQLTRQPEAGSLLNPTGKSQRLQHPRLYQHKLESFQLIPHLYFLLNSRNNLGCTKEPETSEFEWSTGIECSGYLFFLCMIKFWNSNMDCSDSKGVV